MSSLVKTLSGPLMIDVKGLRLDANEKRFCDHPLVGGVILFARNFTDKDQLSKLTDQIRSINPALLIAVDQEGGRVQRFKQGFTTLSPLRPLGELYQQDSAAALAAATDHAHTMATELLAVGIDISFAPVLDLDLGVSEIIGDRSFGSDANNTIALAQAYIAGMHAAGMMATGKHFPGHGAVAPDSHKTLPIDKRDFATIWAEDIAPYIALKDQLGGVMAAHIVYPQCDDKPAGFSRFWLNEVLRERIGFQGIIFSDDLSMAGARCMGDYPTRVKAALDAGCDMALLCNQPDAIEPVLENLT